MKTIIKLLNIGQQAIPRHGHDTEGRKDLGESTHAQGRHCPDDGSREGDWFDQVAGKSAEPGAYHSGPRATVGNCVNVINEIGAAVSQFDISHAGNELLDKATQTLTRFPRHLVDRPHTCPGEAHEQNIKAPEKHRGYKCDAWFKRQ